MKLFALITIWVFAAGLQARASTYFVDLSKSPNQSALQATYQVEFKTFHRQSQSNAWVKTNEGMLCFGKEKNCFTKIADRLTYTQVPKPNLEDAPVPTTTLFIYGIEFENPVGEKVGVTTSNMITEKVGDQAVTVVMPRLASVKNLVAVGTWTAIEFNEGIESFRKLEARIVQAPKE